MSFQIVTVNVNVTVAAQLSQYQRSGAIVSQGGTVLAANATSFLTQPSDLTPLLPAPLALSSIVWNNGIATATTTAPHGVQNGQTFLTTLVGQAPSGYAGTFVATATGSATFTYALATNPGAETIPGTYTRPSVAATVARVTTFFAQGAQTGVSILELGTSSFPTAGIAVLQAFDIANPNLFYAYRTPGEWDAQAAFLALVLSYNGTTAKKYFFIDTTAANLPSYTAQMKSVFAVVPSPTASTTENQASAPFQSFLNNQPSAVSKVPQMSYRFMFGVTPWPLQGNTATINQVLALKGNVILTGAEGGISNATLYRGTMMDGNNASFWYAVDWVQIQAQLQLANAIINGSNNPQNPLYYNQDGINTLRAVAQGVVNSGIAFGLILAPATVVATPFVTYTQQNPNDYAAGIYNGLALTFTPQLGFTSITFNIQVDQFVPAPTSPQGGS
jgi:hypothetical protein